MKGKFIVIFLFLLALTGINSKESVLIDFNLLKANGNGDPNSQYTLDKNDPKMLDYTNHDPVNRRENMPTLLNYSVVADSGFSENEKKKMVISLSAYNWDVILNSSARSVQNRQLSQCIEWHTRYNSILDDRTKDQSGNFISPPNAPQGYTILGVRIHFSSAPYNNWALIKPPFEIPAYEDKVTNYKGVNYNDLYTDTFQRDEALRKGKGNKYGEGYGVVKNVGVLKKIKIRIFGCNFKNSLSILLRDQDGIIKEYQMKKYLNFDGWKQINWTNPNYITNANNRNLFIIPMYPRSEPFVKLYGFRIYRQGDQYGGDFITYIKDVKVVYDVAIVQRDINFIEHEQAWGILQKKSQEAKVREINRLGVTQILRYLERQKIDRYSH